MRNGEIVGVSKKKLKKICVVGIGGSYLGCAFVYEALRNYANILQDYELIFLANVDPIDF